MGLFVTLTWIVITSLITITIKIVICIVMCNLLDPSNLFENDRVECLCNHLREAFC